MKKNGIIMKQKNIGKNQKSKRKRRKKNKEKKMFIDISDLRWSEIQKVELMLKEDKLRTIERYVLNEYLKSLKNNIFPYPKGIGYPA